MGPPDSRRPHARSARASARPARQRLPHRPVERERLRAHAPRRPQRPAPVLRPPRQRGRQKSFSAMAASPQHAFSRLTVQARMLPQKPFRPLGLDVGIEVLVGVGDRGAARLGLHHPLEPHRVALGHVRALDQDAVGVGPVLLEGLRAAAARGWHQIRCAHRPRSGHITPLSGRALPVIANPPSGWIADGLPPRAPGRRVANQMQALFGPRGTRVTLIFELPTAE